MLTLIKFILSFHKQATLVHGFFYLQTYTTVSTIILQQAYRILSLDLPISQLLSQLVLMGSHHLHRTFLVLALEVPRHRIPLNLGQTGTVSHHRYSLFFLNI